MADASSAWSDDTSLDFALEALGPHETVGPSVDELRRDPHLVAGAKNRALEHRIDVKQLSRFPAEAARRALELHRRSARRHAKRADRRERRGQLIGHSLGEVILRRVGRSVVEWKDGDRCDRCVRALRRQRPRRSPSQQGVTGDNDDSDANNYGGRSQPSRTLRHRRDNASLNSRAVAKRSLGDFMSARCNAASIAGGTSSRKVRSGAGVSVISFVKLSCADDARAGEWPASISYATDASEKMSLRASSARSPAACSGLMYSTVPSERPVPRQPCFRGFVAADGDAKVREHRFSILEKNVLRLDVAMNDAVAMRVVERARDLLNDAERIAGSEPSVARRSVAQRLAAYSRHHIEQHSARASESNSGRMCEC